MYQVSRSCRRQCVSKNELMFQLFSSNSSGNERVTLEQRFNEQAGVVYNIERLKRKFERESRLIIYCLIFLSVKTSFNIA